MDGGRKSWWANGGGGRVPREPLPEVSRGDPEGGLGGVEAPSLFPQPRAARC